MGKIDLEKLCRHCKVVRRWRRDGSCNLMSVAAGVENLSHHTSVCRGQSLPSSWPTPEQERALRGANRLTSGDALRLLYRGEMLGTQWAEFWLSLCDGCRREMWERQGEEADRPGDRPVKEDNEPKAQTLHPLWA